MKLYKQTNKKLLTEKRNKRKNKNNKKRYKFWRLGKWKLSCEIWATEEPQEDSKLEAKQGVYWKQGPSEQGRICNRAEASSQFRPVPTRVVLCWGFEGKKKQRIVGK